MIQAQQQQVPETVYVIFTAEIKVQTVQSHLGVMSNCATQGVKKVYLALSTPGGDVMQGALCITCYEACRSS